MNGEKGFLSENETKQQDKMSNFKKAFVLISILDESFSEFEYRDHDRVFITEMIKKMYSDYTDFKLRNENKDDILKEEMNLIKVKEKALLNAKYPISKEYYSVELFFKKQCEIEKGIDPTFDIEVFAECENIRIESILDQVKQLSDKSYYGETDTYKQALKYIKYLSKVIKGEANKDNTPKTFEIDCNPVRLNIIRERLISAKIINRISKEDFTYLFTGKPITKVMKSLIWNKSLSLGHEFLKRFVYQSEKFDFTQVNKCIKYPNGKELARNNKSTAVYKCDDILNPILDN